MFQTGKDVWDFVPNLPTDFQCRSLLSLPQFAALKREAKGREKRVLFLFFFFLRLFLRFFFLTMILVGVEIFQKSNIFYWVSRSISPFQV